MFLAQRSKSATASFQRFRHNFQRAWSVIQRHSRGGLALGPTCRRQALGPLRFHRCAQRDQVTHPHQGKLIASSKPLSMDTQLRYAMVWRPMMRRPETRPGDPRIANKSTVIDIPERDRSMLAVSPSRVEGWRNARLGGGVLLTRQSVKILISSDLYRRKTYGLLEDCQS